MSERETQNRQILRHMSAGHKVTDATARELFQCSRISARVWDLRHIGIPVVDGWEYKYDSDGKVVKKWKAYWIAGPAN